MIEKVIAPRPKGYVRPTPEMAFQLQRFVERWGEPVARKVFGLSAPTIARVAARFPVLGSCLSSVELGLQVPEEKLQQFAAHEGRP